MTQAEFSNALRILCSVDFYDVEDILHPSEWKDFQKDPCRFWARADDVTQDKLWTVVEARAWKRKPAMAAE